MSADILQIRTQMERDVQRIYDRMGTRLNQINSNDIASTLIRLETEEVNGYITDLVEKVRAAAIEELKRRAYPEYLTAGAWAKIIRSVGMPKMKLCSVQQFNNAVYTDSVQPQNATVDDARSQKEMKSLKYRRNAGIGAAGVGGSAVIAAIVIPGWEAIPMTLLCAGGVVLICGSVSAITAQREIETIKSRMEKEQMKAAPDMSSPSAFIKRLTDFQAQNNIKVINDWMDKIESVIDDLCRADNT